MVIRFIVLAFSISLVAQAQMICLNAVRYVKPLAQGSQSVLSLMRYGDISVVRKVPNARRKEWQKSNALEISLLRQLEKLSSEINRHFPKPFEPDSVRPNESYQEFIDGNNLAHIIDKHLPSQHSANQLTLSLASQLAEGLSGLHQLGYIHGDIKPWNIMLAKDGRVVIVDLGFAGKEGVGRKEPAYSLGYGHPGRYSSLTPSILDDMYGVRIILQETLLRRYISEVSAKFTALGNTAQWRILTRSPYSIESDLPEVLSTLAWHTFGDTKEMVKAAEVGKRALLAYNPDLFFRDYFGPEILAHLSAEEAFVEIFTAKELWTRFQRGTLGLSREKTLEILAAEPTRRSKACLLLRRCFWLRAFLKDYVDESAIEEAKKTFH